MSLVSNLFLLFTAAAVIIYYLVPDRIKWMVLLVFSYLYYLCGGVRYLFFILYSTIVIYLFAILIEGGWGKAVMVCYIISNLCSIMIQRYNRPRIQMIIKRIEKRNA